ncbi:MAG: DUF1820 family protein [Pseudomonadota bacterium]
MSKNTLYRVKFVNQNQLMDVYVREVFQAELYGFVVLRDFVFGETASLVVDPAEEKLKAAFQGVQQTWVPMHAIVRIDQVEKRGTATLTEITKDNIAAFPSPIYTPRDAPEG